MVCAALGRHVFTVGSAVHHPPFNPAQMGGANPQPANRFVHADAARAGRQAKGQGAPCLWLTLRADGRISRVSMQQMVANVVVRGILECSDLAPACRRRVETVLHGIPARSGHIASPFSSTIYLNSSLA